MPRLEPEYLNPIVGFLQWHLANGTSEAEALERLSMKAKYGRLDEEDIKVCLARAKRNVMASENIHLLTPTLWRQPDATYSTSKPKGA